MSTACTTRTPASSQTPNLSRLSRTCHNLRPTVCHPWDAVAVYHSSNPCVTVSSAGSSVGTGGMGTKIVAARLGITAGVMTIITRSANPGNIINIVRYLQGRPQASAYSCGGNDGLTQSSAPLKLGAASTCDDPNQPTAPHTRSLPSSEPMRDRHFWLLHTPTPHDTIY